MLTTPQQKGLRQHIDPCVTSRRRFQNAILPELSKGEGQSIHNGGTRQKAKEFNGLAGLDQRRRLFDAANFAGEV